ncbi:hypothetical protein [Lichenifustis flavocetrariae]|uniref:GIY-YIG domain-containing protein n=1 Tax=Lichenifustis flavocetrariae TaxID=2949735 RepID=A0AA41Z1A6_9HYPH|nr:hypothetical protein [Lichenifustis flavocetrariae]MCW6510993.1 hypothetical protein [Lichenifustis flavocetrariae]
MEAPPWFTQLRWSTPIHVAALNCDRSLLPDFTGCYAFTIGVQTVAPGHVLYIGEAAGQTLRQRIPSYLVNFRADRLVAGPGSRRRGHKGKGFILEAREQFGDQGIYVSWVEYGASEADIHILEASLIHYLNPAANDRIEEYRHALLGDDERLNRHLIR